MADSSILLNTNTSTGATVDTRTNTGGEHRQVVVIGEGAATSDAVIPGDATNGLLVNPSDRAARDNGKVDIAAFDTGLPSGTAWLGTVAIASGGSISIHSAGSLTVTVSSTGSTVAVSQYTNPWTVGGTVAVSGVSGAVEILSAGTLAVTITSSGSSVAVHDNGGSLTVDGTVAVSSVSGTIQLASAGTLAVTITSSGSSVAVHDNGGSLTVDGTVAVSAIASALPAGTNWLGTIAIASSTTYPVTDNSGSLTVDAPLATPVFVTPTPNTTGGWSMYFADGLQASSIVTVKHSAGNLGGWYIYNPNSSAAYVQIFDTNGTVTLGASTPRMSLGIPATSAANLEPTCGINFANGIKIAATTASSGSTNPSSTLTSNWFYK